MPIGHPHTPLGRMMVFVDGENLVFRYQEMIKSGRKPRDLVSHEEDVFVWASACVKPGYHQVTRATYYTYASGSQETIDRYRAVIKSSLFNQAMSRGIQGEAHFGNTLYPCVFHKPAKTSKAKGVDIQMTVDILTHVVQDNLDTVYLISGDGDYEPVIREAIRYGKRVIVAALSDGLNERLRTIADQFICLDPYYFAGK